MKAAVYTKYGPPEVFQIKEIDKPHPKENEVLVKIHATTVNRTDTGMTSANYIVSRVVTGLFKPTKTTPGTDFSGVVEAIGIKVTRFKVGDEVFGFDDNILSSHAEYMCIDSYGKIEFKPQNVSHEVAAASCEGAHYALNMMKSGKVRAGQKILVNGATGAIGSAAVQLLKNKGIHVTAVANTKSLELIKSLGADRVIDYLKEDFTLEDEEYDIIVDAVGKSSFKKCKKLLKKKGIYMSSELGKGGANVWLALLKPFMGSKKVHFPIPQDIKTSLSIMKKHLEKYNFKPVIEKRYKLEEIVEAYTYAASGQKTGNLIIEMV